jgi:antitoxin MazE
MRTELIRIGNSRGVRIPKPLIEQCGFKDVVELRVENDRLIVSPERQVRQGWADAFRAAEQVESDELLLEHVPPNKFDSKDWRW